MVTSPEIKKVSFAGLNFYRRKDGYYIRQSGKTSEQLHRVIYQIEIGQIPDGFEIHHKDHDKENNDPSNLEALSPEDHEKLHKSRPRQAAYWERREFTPRKCAVCGSEFMSNGTRPAFICSSSCSNLKQHGPKGLTEKGAKCQQASKSMFAAMLPKNYTCATCGKDFERKSIRSVKYCQSKCKSRSDWMRKKERMILNE